MLICPQCQQENPDYNKFCIHCGTSLTYKLCPQCGTQVSFQTKECVNCGTVTGRILWGVLSGSLPLSPLQEDPCELDEGEMGETVSGENLIVPVISPSTKMISSSGVSDDLSGVSPPIPSDEIEHHETDLTVDSDWPSAATSSIISAENPLDSEDNLSSNSLTHESFSGSQKEGLSVQMTSFPSIPAGSYLERQQRYQLLETIPPRESLQPVLIPVLDCYPLQISLLKSLLISQSDPPDFIRSYLTLKTDFPQHFLEVYDGWEESDRTIILLQETGESVDLLKQWSDYRIPLQNLVEWLKQITDLWEALAKWNCCQSLLIAENLRVVITGDQEIPAIQVLGLYQTLQESSPTLQDLGKFWQYLFEQSQRTLFGQLSDLLKKLPSGEIKTIAELKLELQEVEKELKPHSVYLVSNENDDPWNEEEENSGGIGEPVFTNQLDRLEEAGITDLGRQRAHNEDYYSLYTEYQRSQNNQECSVKAKGLYIICDGMGGHDHGEVASQLAVHTLQKYFQEHWHNELPSEMVIFEGILAANHAIYEINQSNSTSGSGRMGTTLVMVLIQDKKVAVAHVGDSRVYRLQRGGLLEQITTDHEVGQREIQRGIDPETAYARPDAFQLTQALGPREDDFVRPDIRFLEICDDTLFVLASDGLTDNQLLEIHWQTNLQPLLEPHTSLEDGVQDLIDLANEYNGHDNITALIVRVLV